jgi:hypothetical protein
VGSGEGRGYRQSYPYDTDQQGPNIIEAPYFVTNYSQKFQWIMEGLPHTPPSTRAVSYADSDWDFGRPRDKAVILDDDLVFSRRNAEGKLITERDPEQLAPMFAQMEHLLDTYPLVGIHPRAMGHAAPQGHVENGRIICVQGINRRLIGPVQVDQFPILADVILNLTLLARGDKNAIITDFFQDHGPCQAPGGCSIYRTPAMQEQVIDYLVARWPGYVRKVVRKPKVAKWLGDERVEYTAQWKRLQAAAPDALHAVTKVVKNGP